MTVNNSTVNISPSNMHGTQNIIVISFDFGFQGKIAVTDTVRLRNAQRGSWSLSCSLPVTVRTVQSANVRWAEYVTMMGDVPVKGRDLVSGPVGTLRRRDDNIIKTGRVS
jgi:hypothetical protein